MLWVAQMKNTAVAKHFSDFRRSVNTRRIFNQAFVAQDTPPLPLRRARSWWHKSRFYVFIGGPHTFERSWRRGQARSCLASVFAHGRFLFLNLMFSPDRGGGRFLRLEIAQSMKYICLAHSDRV